MEQTADQQELYLSTRWQQFTAGDKNAFGEIAECHYAALHHYGTRFTQDRELIKDCIQDLFLQIWERRDSLSVIDSIKPYLFQSLRNNLLRRIKKQAVFSDISKNENDLLDDLSPESDWILHETDQLTTDRLAHAINLLPKRQREALYLKFYQNLSYDEIAEVMGLNRQAVANYLQYGLQKLREYWQHTIIFLTLLPGFLSNVKIH
ncbi:sigma-70 family RNA polymerase sigma factor [Dyadobacter sp. LHD-138]|uniref:RNA polymerase sigma factor n=1 Tax=Dyadobacter sp. LHD-138 TaxID=3071413 RepID=UPI0027DF17AC|nr:sigma-70 family RNA polymerase sigma factor [Dyadobacter sp. LHD-138]MDQ6477193.1 sigma-70 family RNA polymerase sigma factor [Dyadobacter sp. LHD-138]